MKHLKVTSVLLAAVMSLSMVMTPVSVLADETETPSETQTTEAAEENEPEEEEPEVVEDQGEPEFEAQRDAEDAVLAKGKCGKKVKWTLDKKGTLKITGKGAMYNYVAKSDKGSDFFSTAPWFKYASKIKKVVVSKKVTTIGAFSFYMCSNLSSVSLPKKLKAINNGAFCFCEKLTKISIPKKLKVISEGSFANTGLISVVIPKKVQSIDFCAFYNCLNLKSVSIPGSVKTIGVSAFQRCALTTVTIPASVKTIKAQAFSYCKELKTVKIPVSGLNSIGDNAFERCVKLESFNIPLSVMSIGSEAFSGCEELGKVWISKKQKAYMFSSSFSGCPKMYYEETDYACIEQNIKVGDINYIVLDPAINGSGTVEVYEVDVDKEKIVIPAVIGYNGVKYKVVKIACFTNKQNDLLSLKSLVIGSNVASIADNALSGCPNLESVTGGAGLKTIGANAFANCPKLKLFNISSKTLKKIGTYAFSGDTALTTLQLKKTTKLTKSGVKNSLKDSSVKTVKVKKSKVKKYKKIFKAKNCGKKVKVKK